MEHSRPRRFHCLYRYVNSPIFNQWMADRITSDLRNDLGQHERSS